MVGQAPRECFSEMVTEREGEAGSVRLGERGSLPSVPPVALPQGPCPVLADLLAAGLSLFGSGLRPRTQRGHLNLPLPSRFFPPHLDLQFVGHRLFKATKAKIHLESFSRQQDGIRPF